MSIPLVLVVFVALILLLGLVLLLIKKIGNLKLKEKSKPNNTGEESTCKKVENCWCVEYDLTKEKKQVVLKELGDQYCGKTVRSIVNNE